MKKDATKSDLKRLDALSDEEIDYSDIPELDASFFREARVVTPPGKKQLTIRLDNDVLSWFKEQGRGYQSRMNAVLRAYYEAHEGDARLGGVTTQAHPAKRAPTPRSTSPTRW